MTKNKLKGVRKVLTKNQREALQAVKDFDTKLSSAPANPKTKMYKCGHEAPIAVIMNSNLLSISAYITWQEDYADEMCFDCYCKREVKDSSWAGISDVDWTKRMDAIRTNEREQTLKEAKEKLEKLNNPQIKSKPLCVVITLDEWEAFWKELGGEK